MSASPPEQTTAGRERNVLMLRLVEFALLAVTLVIVLGLVLAGPVEAPPSEERPVGAADALPKPPQAN